jgi:hypothetical protein
MLRGKRLIAGAIAAAVVFGSAAISGTAKASVYDFTFHSTIKVASTPGISVGDAYTLNLFLDNGGSTLASQIWTDPDALGFTIDAGSYHATYSTPFPGVDFETDASGALIQTSFFGTDGSSSNQDNFGSWIGDYVFGGGDFLDFLGRGNAPADVPSDTIANWSVTPVAAPAAVPLPGTLPLFVGGLGGLLVLCWRRTKRPARA